jgi:hypothetical protein
MGHGLAKAVAAAAAVAAAVAVGWMLWPRPTAAPVSATTTRQYLDASACLLTGADGVTPGTPGAPVWRAMESASAATRVMASYLPAATPADAGPMLNTLVERQCGVIVVMDASLAQVAKTARANPARRFILVTGSAADGPAVVPSNAVVVQAADAARPIDQAVTALAGAA